MSPDGFTATDFEARRGKITQAHTLFMIPQKLNVPLPAL